MIRLLIAFITFLSSLSANATGIYGGDPNKVFSLVVSSTYATPKGGITISGNGVLVTDFYFEKYAKDAHRVERFLDYTPGDCVHCRYFVITASHVSQGADTTVVINGRPQTIIGRYADLISDIEVLEIQRAPGLEPQAYYYARWNAFGAHYDATDDDYLDKKDNHPVRDVVTDAHYHSIQVASPIDAKDSFVLEPSFRTCDAPKGYSRNNHKDGHSTNELSAYLLQNGYDEQVVNAWLPPGYSGSPMLTKLELGDRLNGIVTEYDRRFQISYLASENSIVGTFRGYLDGARGVRNAQGLMWSWRHNGLTTFREGSDKPGRIRVRETELTHGNAGSSTSGDGGHGSGGDGGHGSGGDGGHGSGGDGGSGGICPKGPDLTKLLTDGLWLDQQQIFAFKLADGSALAADVQSYALYGNGIKGFVPWGSELISLFKFKLPYQLSKNSMLIQLTKKESWGTIGRPVPLVQYKLNQDSIELLITDDAYDDSLKLSINRFGGVGKNAYQRLVDVKSKNGVNYILDLTGLFVIDFKNTGMKNALLDYVAPNIYKAPYIFIQRGDEPARYIAPVVAP